MHWFELSSEEANTLKTAVSGDEPLSVIIQAGEASSGGGLILQLEREQAERLRDCLTERLAKIGFDKDYSPTKDGELLEELIDRFYIP